MLSKSEEMLGDNGYDRLLEHRSRLAICVLLSKHDKISFSRFKELLNESDGNLGAQLKKLEEAKYVNVKKEFADRKPVTWYSITKSGKSALKQHVIALGKIIEKLK